MLTLERSKRGAITLIEADGSIDSGGAEKLAAFLRSEAEAGAGIYVLDLERVDAVGLDGLWELMAALKRARRAGGDLRLAQPSDRARAVLAASRLDEILPVYETRAEAMASASLNSGARR